MTELRVKYIQHPYSTEAVWIARNPLLKNGEEGYAMMTVNGVDHIRKKIGPGLWNDLEYYDGVVWIDSTAVTNPIGDAQGDLSGLTPIEILDLMLNEYQAPVVSGAVNDGGTGTSASTKTLEIGTTTTNPVIVGYTVSQQNNLVGGNPISITAGGRFINEGFFPVGPVSLTHAGFSPVGLDTITIAIRASHQNGLSNIANTTLQWSPKIISAVAQTKILDGNAIMALPNKSYNISRSYKRDYSANTAGHSVLCIPVMLAPTNVVFTDVTDPNLPAGYSMDDLGVMSINNGVGTYDYQVYASTYYLLNSTIYRVA